MRIMTKKKVDVPIQTDSIAKGAIFLMAGQATLLVAGYLVHAYLGRTLGPVRYGAFGVVMALLVWFEVSLTGAFPYAIRKFGAENRSLMSQVASIALRGQLVYAFFIFALVELFAPAIASALGDPSLTLLIRIATIDIPVYAAYFCYLGVLNGYSMFRRQSLSITIYSGTKLAAMVVLVHAGYGIKGAFIGNAVASVLGLAAARITAGSIRSVNRYPLGNIIGFVIGTASLAIVYTFLMNLDIFMVEAFVKNKSSVGAYVAAWTLARAPFLVFLAIANVTLPAVSRAYASHDYSLACTYINQSFRLHLMLLMPFSAIVSASSAGIVRLVYSSGYSEAAAVLSILVPAFMCWGLLNGIYNLQLARQQTVYPVVSTVVLILVMALLSWRLIPLWGALGAARAAMLVSAFGLFVASIGFYRTCGVLVPIMSLSRITLASSAAYAVARISPTSGIGVLGIMALASVVYVGMLVITCELSRQDRKRLAAVVRG